MKTRLYRSFVFGLACSFVPFAHGQDSIESLPSDQFLPFPLAAHFIPQYSIVFEEDDLKFEIVVHSTEMATKSMKFIPLNDMHYTCLKPLFDLNSMEEGIQYYSREFLNAIRNDPKIISNLAQSIGLKIASIIADEPASFEIVRRDFAAEYIFLRAHFYVQTEKGIFPVYLTLCRDFKVE